MDNFKVGTKIEQVEVYVHNYEEYFLQTVMKMNIAEEAQKSLSKVSKNLQNGIKKYRSKVSKVEEAYLKESGYKTKDKYREEVIKYSNKEDSEINRLLNDYTMLSPDNLKSLQQYVQELNKPLPTRAEAKQEISKRLEPLIKNLGIIIKSLIEEKKQVSGGQFDKTNMDALRKRKQAQKDAAAKVSSEDLASQIANAKTLPQLRKIIGKLRYEHLGIMFEPLAGLFLENFHANGKKQLEELTNNPGPKVQMRLTGDMGTKKVGTTDLVLITKTMNIGVDVKSSARMYVKGTQKQGYGYELTSQILLGNGGLNKFFGNLGGEDPELLKKIAYIIVNMNIFNNVSAIKETRQFSDAYNAMRSMVVVAGLLDFLKVYIEKFDNIYRKQILIMAGKEVYFLTDLMDMLIYMVDSTKSISKSQFGTFYNVATKSSPTANVGKHANLLDKKREVMINGKVTYEFLFNRLGAKEMKELVAPALKQSMQVRLNLPLSKMFGKTP